MSESSWKSTSWFLVGLIAGFMLAAFAENGLWEDEVKAGYLQRGGVAYKVERIGQ